MRGCDVTVDQPTSTPDPNTTIMPLTIRAPVARRGGAERITAVMPIYAYARQDKKDRSRAPITGKLVADMIEVAGANRVVTIDLHASQIQGFVTYPLDNLYAMPLLESFLLQHFADRNIPQDDIVVVSPDAGAAKRAQYLATAIGDVPLAIFSKQRLRPNEVAKMILVGEVKDKVCVIIDDMADTCGTLVLAAKELKQAGAKEVIAVITHGIFSSDALDKINKSELAMVVCTDSIPMHENEKKCPKLKVISVADLLARSIVGAHTDQSMESLFQWRPPAGTYRPTLSA
jgi:ribose-phosphate pyrophosphokinase